MWYRAFKAKDGMGFEICMENDHACITIDYAKTKREAEKLVLKYTQELIELK